MNGGVIADNQLHDCLRKTGIDVEIEHDFYGTVDTKLKTEFVRQQYLVHSKVTATDPPQFEYHWGPRANIEVSKKKVIQFVAKVYGEEDPSIWTSQWEEATEHSSPEEPEQTTSTQK